jgi:L-alanine-DL-glutamate epimerase-like enolase superfamily enzyme
MKRRGFLKDAALLASGAAVGLPSIGSAADIDAIVDSCIDSNHKFPWSFICRAIGGVDTAIWDLYGRIKQQPVAELLGGKVRPLPAYGSSMSRTISPEDEAARLVKLRDEQGFQGFSWRVAQMAQRAGKLVVPHSANHSMVTLFTLHLFAALPNAGPFMEWRIEPGDINQQAKELFGPNPFVKDGKVHFAAGPGWGVKINLEWLKAATYQKSELKA